MEISCPSMDLIYSMAVSKSTFLLSNLNLISRQMG